MNSVIYFKLFTRVLKYLRFNAVRERRTFVFVFIAFNELNDANSF